MNRKSASILLLGSEKDSELADALFELGFELVARESMFGALERVRRARFAAILIDRRAVDFDALEFTLNARDVDGDTPILIVGRGRDPHADRRLRSMDGVRGIDDFDGVDAIGDEMEKAITKGHDER